MICSVPRNSSMGDYQNIWLTGEHSEPIGTIRTLAYGPTQKSPPSVQAVFQVAPAPIPSRFLCPRPPLLLSAPNQNRYATQATIDSTDARPEREHYWITLVQLSFALCKSVFKQFVKITNKKHIFQMYNKILENIMAHKKRSLRKQPTFRDVTNGFP